MTDISVPNDLWDDGSPGVISSWLFGSGDIVSSGTVVAEIMNEKVSFEILAPDDGKLAIGLPAETEITLGQVIGHIEPA